MIIMAKKSTITTTRTFICLNSKCEKNKKKIIKKEERNETKTLLKNKRAHFFFLVDINFIFRCAK